MMALDLADRDALPGGFAVCPHAMVADELKRTA
jgi:hypothetical protein